MNERQRRFAREYIISLNGKQAAIKAGYAAKTAEVKASQLLRHVKVRPFIQKLMDQRAAKLEISAENVLAEIAKLGFSNMQDYVTEQGSLQDIATMDRDKAAAIQEIRVDESAGGAGDGVRERVKRTTFKLADKGINLERLGKHLKLFSDKVELTGKDGEPLQPMQVVVRFVKPGGLEEE